MGLHLSEASCVALGKFPSLKKDCHSVDLSGGSHGFIAKNPSAMQEVWVWSLGWEDPLEEEMAILSSIFAWEIHGQRSLVGYSPWGCKESDTTEQITHA